MSFPVEVALEQTQVGFAQSWEEVSALMEWLKKPRDVLAIDTETSGISPYEKGARIRLAQFGDVNEAWSLDALRWPGLVQHIVETYPGEIVLHNGAFDYKWLAVTYPGIKLPWSRSTDTMLLARIDPYSENAGLKPLSVKHFGGKAAVGQAVLQEAMNKNGWTWDTVPLELPAYSQYAALDCILTARLYRKLKHIKTGPTARICDLEHNVRRIANNMELRGFLVDREYCEEKLLALDKYVEDVKVYCKDTYDVEIGSTMQLGRYFEKQGVELVERTGTGAPKMTAEVLEWLSGKYEVADLALKARKSDKVRGTYFENILKFSEFDGRVHCQINTLEARTGRMSITAPALQTLPTKGEGATVRKAFLPTPGHMLYSADYSSIESRLAAHFGKDENMIEAFRVVDEEGGDFFVELGKNIWGPDFTKADPRRAMAKVVVYSGLYGAGVHKMAMAAKVEDHEMQKISDDLFASYPAIKNCQKIFTGEAERNNRSGEFPYITTNFGRELRIDAQKMYTAANYAIQGHAAELLKQAVVNCDMAGLGEYLTLPIHDELVFDVPETRDSVEIIHEIRECMEVTKDMGYLVPLPVSPEGPMDRWDAK